MVLSLFFLIDRARGYEEPDRPKRCRQSKRPTLATCNQQAFSLRQPNALSAENYAGRNRACGVECEDEKEDYAGIHFSLTSKVSHTTGWRGACCSEHDP